MKHHNLVVKRLKNALKMNLEQQIQKIFPAVHPKYQAELIEALDEDERRKLIKILGEKIKSTLLIKLRQKTRYEVISYLDKRHINALFLNLLSKQSIIDDIIKDILIIENEKDNIFESVAHSVKERIPWLILAILLASLSSLVIDQFSETIKQFVVLSALMPLIVDLSGVSGNQTLTILIRDLGRYNDLKSEMKRIIVREIMIGFLNGMFLSIISGICIYLWQKNLALTISFSISLWVLQILSSLFGSLIPVVLNFLKMDPAISSNIFINVILDTLSYLLLLGVASLLLI